MAGFFDRLTNPKMPGESESEYESRKRREQAAGSAEAKRRQAVEEADKKRKRPVSDYPDKFSTFMSWLKGG